MRRLLILFLSFFVFPAFAVTSESYVDSAVNTLQEQIPAVNINTVLTNTGVAGEIGTKKIYDETQSFGTQTDALVTAETFNAAVQNAIDNEYVCIEWLGEHVPGNCLLWQLQNKTPQQIVPDGYTRLEYLFSNGKAHFNTNIPWVSVTRFRGKAQQYAISSTNQAVLGSSADINPSAFYGTYYLSQQGGETGWYWRSGVSPTIPADFDVYRISNTEWTGTVNNVETSTQSAIFTGTVLVMTSGNGYLDYRSFNGYVWYIQLFGQNGNMLFNGIPARRNSDNESGMYDMVTGTFFTNSGAGEFIAGPDVNSNLYLPSGD